MLTARAHSGQARRPPSARAASHLSPAQLQAFITGNALAPSYARFYAAYSTRRSFVTWLICSAPKGGPRRGVPRELAGRSPSPAARQVEHLLDCIARIVRCLLGQSALADEKISCAVPLGILGLRVDLSSEGMTCVPLPDKIAKWSARITLALDSGILRAGAGPFAARHASSRRARPGDASKLAGALAWASGNMFNRAGRAMLRCVFCTVRRQRIHSPRPRCGRPIYAQAHRRSPDTPQALRLVLRWWLIVLGGELAQSRKWCDEAAGPVAHLFCDAASRPPMAAAVLFVDNKCYWTCMPPAARCGCSGQRRFWSRRERTRAPGS